MSRKSDLLNNIGEKLSNININIENIDLNALVELKEELLNTSDERHQSYTIHSTIDIFMITFFAILSDCDEWVQIEMFAKKHYDWFKKFLSLNAGIPKAVTFKRVMSVINPNEVEPILVNFLLKILKQYQNILNDKSKYSNEKDVYAMDGKSCNSSGRNSSKTGEIKSIQAMSIYSNNLGICLATEFIEEKTNEIPTGPKLLSLLNLENIIVTFDALNTQEKTIDTIVNQNGYYVAAVKSNQENTYEDLVNYFEDEKILKQLEEENYCCNTEKNHSSIIKYEYYQVEDVIWLYNYKKWRNIKSIGCVKKILVIL